MTRPAGVTPKGLPYPGSADIHVQTPAALKALAEAIEANISSLGGIIMDFYRGPITLTKFTGWGSFVIPFPNLAAVSGYIAGWGIDDGGQDANGYLTGNTETGFCAFYATPQGSNAGPVPSSITVHAIGWGPPRQ